MYNTCTVVVFGSQSSPSLLGLRHVVVGLLFYKEPWHLFFRLGFELHLTTTVYKTPTTPLTRLCYSAVVIRRRYQRCVTAARMQLIALFLISSGLLGNSKHEHCRVILDRLQRAKFQSDNPSVYSVCRLWARDTLSCQWVSNCRCLWQPCLLYNELNQRAPEAIWYLSLMSLNYRDNFFQCILNPQRQEEEAKKDSTLEMGVIFPVINRIISCAVFYLWKQK